MRHAPPSAKRVVCVDFDGTIAPWGKLFDLPEPFPGVADAMRALRSAGYRIVILTSRLSEAWQDADHLHFGFSDPIAFDIENREYVRSYLRRYNIPWDDITAEKIPAVAYFDDHAVHVSTRHPLTSRIRCLLAGAGA